MKLRIFDYLSNVKEMNGAALSANLKCTCGATEFKFFHTGKQTKGLFSPFVVKKEGQLILKAVCSCCSSSIVVYDSTKDGENPKDKDIISEFTSFSSNKVPDYFSVAIKYNYYPEKMLIDGVYSNCFENCYIYILDEKGNETKALIEE